MPNIVVQNRIDVSQIFDGDIIFVAPLDESKQLMLHAISLIEEVFEASTDSIIPNVTHQLDEFVARAKKVKTTFTNDAKTSCILRNILLARYKKYRREDLLFDLPRLRIIPNSRFLASGISYNYQAHRDTWYGARQDQVNHWMSVANVTPESTFYISPGYFTQPVENSSNTFDLDEWDSKYRNVAHLSKTIEKRPHPLPVQDLPTSEKYNVVLPEGYEIVFSGHHLHGSSPNTTSKVRFSIDYRVCVNGHNISPPLNIDNEATGDYEKYMFCV
jgi:hypothetical protein